MDDENDDDSDFVVVDSKRKRKKTRKSAYEWGIQKYLVPFRVVQQREDALINSSAVLTSKRKSLKLNVYAEDLPKLIHIFELILNFKPKEFDLYSSLQPYNAYGLKTTKKRDLIYSIHSCLVSKRYQEATKLLELLSVEKGGKDHIFYYGTFQILNNTRNISTNEVEVFIRSCLFLQKLNKKEVLLDFIMYKLQNNDMEFPRELHQKILTIRNRIRKNYTIDGLYAAYISLYDYISWAKICISSDFDQSEGHKFKDSFVSGLSEIICEEGTWDIFIIKIREMLEYYEELDECEEILENHLYANQENLHSHVYLYNFLKKYDRSKEKQKQALENIVKISPSDDLALDYVDILIMENNREEAVDVLLEFLEYSGNKENNEAWKKMSKLVVAGLGNSDTSLLKFLTKRWKKLRSYWPFYHFDIETIDVSSEVKAKCIISKCEFLVTVAEKYKDDLTYNEMVKVLMKSDQPKFYKTLTKKLNKIENLLAS